jgi:glycosyltransferase involved in cell wall biosynthesis
MNKINQNINPKNLKIAILHAFFKSDCKGGGEKLIFEIRDYYGADLFAGGIDLESWGQDKIADSFVKRLWNPRFQFQFLHQDSHIRIWKHLKRQLFFLFSPKIDELENYDVVVFSGNIGNVPWRLKNPKKIIYCHTTPRPFTDQLDFTLSKYPKLLRPIVRFFGKVVVDRYITDAQSVDLVISNSENIKQRLLDYTGIESDVIYPAVDTSKFQYIETGDYFLSYARLEEIKRIKLIVETFANLPDQNLVICSSGPLKDWLKNDIKTRNLTNVVYEGLVTDERLEELVGKCRAGIYIPINEDAGITQIELMAAGKPVIGVDEGALPSTVIDTKTGIIIKANPSEDDLRSAVLELTADKAKSMKDGCQSWSKNFDSKVFFDKMDAKIIHVLSQK